MHLQGESALPKAVAFMFTAMDNLPQVRQRGGEEGQYTDGQF